MGFMIHLLSKVLLILIFLIDYSYAQDAGALQRELQLQIERSAPLPGVERVKPSQPRDVNTKSQKISVKGFKFVGNSLVTDEQLQEVVKSWTNTQLTIDELKDVTTAIQDYYAKQNRIAIARIPPQEIKNDTVLIEIHEGKLGSVIVEPTSQSKSLRISPEVADLYFGSDHAGSQFINTKSMERSLILLNELPGVQASGAFEKGAKPDESDFRVILADRPLFSGDAALSNYGSSSTGVGQAIANLSLNDPLGFGDQATLDAIQSLGSSYGQLAYTFPVGYDGLRLGVQGNYLTYQTLASWNSMQTQGTANTINANATYALIREPGNVVNLRAALEDRNYNNSQLGINISQYQITAFNFGVNGNVSDTSSSIVNYGLTLTAGNLNIQNLTQAGTDFSGPGTAGGYQKLGFNISRNQDLSFLPNTNWLISVYGQFANKNLNSSEQIFMGGPYGVRAYPVAQGGGSQGAILSTELQHHLNENWNIGGFVDVGWVQQYVNVYPNWQGLTNANNNYQLASTGLTAKYLYDHWLVNATLALRVGQNPLYNSSGLQLNADNAYRTVQAWIKGSYAF
jgi:hemolysin activation/secretion protein